LLVTKWSNEAQKESFKDRLVLHVSEENKQLNHLIQESPNDTSIGLAKERLGIF
jgi:hypothetical protein